MEVLHMKKLKKEHFCYGAILTAIMEFNPDANFVLLQRNDDSRKMYRIETATSKECVIYFKYAFETPTKPQSWSFQFSDEEKSCLKSCHAKRIPTFIYLLCGMPSLKDSEIAVLRYDEFNEVSDKINIKLSLKKNDRYFSLARGKIADNAIHIPRHRIEKTFDYLIDDIVKISHNYYCPNCGTKITT